MKKNLPISQKKKFKYSISFQSFDEESLEAGDSFDSGYEIIDATDFIGDILYKAYFTYGIYMPVAFGTWESTNPLENTDYWEKGIQKYFAIHISNEDETQISKEESDFITFLLSDGHYELNKFREYAVGGVVLGSIALGIGALITYFYFKGKKGGKSKKELVGKTSKSVTYKINGKDRKFPIKDAWKKEHTLENQSEDYEVPQAERFEMGGDASEHYYEVEYGEGGVARAKDVIMNKIGYNEDVADYFVSKSEKFAIWLADTVLKNNIFDFKDSKEEYLKSMYATSSRIGANYGGGIRQILDWLQHPVTPKQDLRKLTFDQALEKARDWHQELQVLGGDIDFTEPKTNQILKKYPVNSDGIEYYWAFIPSNYCDLESSRMGHCGRTGFGNTLISLRSVKAYGKGHTISDSHVTIAYGSDGMFYQVKGKKNNKPAEKYFPYIFDLIKTMLTDEEIKHKFNEDDSFTGFGNEYQSSEDYGFEDMSKEQIREMYDLKPTLFESAEDNYMLLDAGVITLDEFKEIVEREPDTFSSFGNQMKLYERGIITEQPSTSFELKYDCDDVYRLLDIDRNFSDDLVAEILCGDIGELYDGWSYYYDNPSDLVSNLNKENEQSVIDEIVRITKLDESVVKENGIEYYLKGEDENFSPNDDFDNIIRALASAQNQADNGDYYKYLYDAVESALNELGEVHSLNDEGVKMTIDLSNSMTLDEIAYEMDYYEFTDVEDLFSEKIGEYIDKPSLRIDDRYSPYGSSEDFNEYISDIDLEQGFKKGGVLRTKNISTNKKIKNMKLIQNKFADGGRLTHFNRHISMDSETMSEILKMTNYPLLKEYFVEKNGEIKYDRIKSELEREGVSTGMINNYLSGLFDGYNYSNTDAFKKEMAKLKIVDKEFYDKVMTLYEKISKYPKINVEYADGGEISVWNLRKGDKIKTRKGDIETITRKIESGYFTKESEYSHPFESIEFIERPNRRMAQGGGDLYVAPHKKAHFTWIMNNYGFVIPNREDVNYTMSDFAKDIKKTYSLDNPRNKEAYDYVNKFGDIRLFNSADMDKFERKMSEIEVEFAGGGRVTTNDGIIEAFLTSNRELKVGNLSTHYNQYDNQMLLRNYGTLIATRKGNDVSITNIKYSKTTTTITNKIRNMALQKRMNISYVDKFADGGETQKVNLGNGEMDLDEAIKIYEEKIKAQGRVVNARDEDVLEQLKRMKNKYAEGGSTDDDDDSCEIQEQLDELVQDFSSDEYKAFCYEHDIDEEDGQEMSAFIYSQTNNRCKEIIQEIEDGYYAGGYDDMEVDEYAEGGETTEFNYLYIKEVPNGLKLELTDEGINGYKEEEINDMYDLFEDIQANSEMAYIDNAGDMGFGLTEAPIITDGYYYDDMGEFTDEGVEDSKVYVWNDYMIKDLFATLMEQGSVVLTEVKSYNYGGETFTEKYIESQGGVDYYSVDYDDVNAQEFRDDIFDTLEEAKLKFDELCENGKTFEDVPLDNVQLLEVYKSGEYQTLNSKMFYDFAKGGNLGEFNEAIVTDFYDKINGKKIRTQNQKSIKEAIESANENSKYYNGYAEVYIGAIFVGFSKNGNFKYSSRYKGDKFAKGGSVKGIKKKAEKLLEDSISFRFKSTDMGSGWLFKLESPLNRSVFNLLDEHLYIDEFSPDDMGIEDYDDLSKEEQDYYYEDWKQELFESSFEAFKEKCKKHLDDFIEYIQQAKEYQDEMNEYAEGGEAGKYSIIVWETEEDRDAGESFVAEILTNKQEALEKAEKMYYKQDFSAIEVIDENDEVILHLSSNEEEDYAGGGSVKKDKLQQARDYWKELEGQMSAKQKKFYNELLKRRQPSFEKNFNDSEIAEYINGEIIEQFGVDLGITKYQITGVNWFKLGFKYIAYREAIEEPEFWEEMNEYAKGGGIKNYTKRELELFDGIFESYFNEKIDEKKILRFRNKLVTMNIGKDNPALDFVISVIDSIVDGELVPAKVQAPYEMSPFEIKAEEMGEELIKINPSYGKGKYANSFAGKDVTLNFAIKLIFSITDGKWVENKNKLASGGEASMIYLISDNATPKREISISENDLLRESKNFFNWRNVSVKRIKSLGSSDYDKFIEFLHKQGYLKEEFAEGGEVEDWMEQALQSLIKETGNEDLDITMVSDNGNEFFAGNDMEEYRVFKTEEDAEEKAIEQVREDLEENPDYFNQDWLMNYIDGRDFFEQELNEMNYSYVEDIASETSGTKYNNRLIDELVENGLMDEDDAILENAEEIADELKYDYVLLLTEEKLDEGNDGLDYFINNFGEKETLKMVINNNLIDIDEASQDAVDIDGIAHFLSSYDERTLYLSNNNVAYRNN